MVKILKPTNGLGFLVKIFAKFVKFCKNLGQKHPQKLCRRLKSPKVDFTPDLGLLFDPFLGQKIRPTKRTIYIFDPKNGLFLAHFWNQKCR